ncbi:MAG TPA: hypothetical protein VNA14_09055 [Mycobacteriales bacterium]|nr:hypothetical protein [Mycobacteriales bacterium]
MSADVAVAGETFGAVIRVDDLPELPADPSSPSGHQWFVLFRVGGHKFFIDARSTTTGTSFYLYEEESFPGLGRPVGGLTGVIDKSKNEIRMWGAVALLGSGRDVARGARIHELEAISARFVGAAAGGSRDVPAQPVHADFATSTQPYVIGTPSCLTVGR